jgi:hypothetical protein
MFGPRAVDIVLEDVFHVELPREYEMGRLGRFLSYGDSLAFVYAQVEDIR